MNGSLPGLLDDPQFQIPNLPTLSDFRIAPLRNPAPSRNANAPLPLEPSSKNALDERHRHVSSQGQGEEDGGKRNAIHNLTDDVIGAREPKKPQIAISELLDATTDEENANLQLPSFVSLSVVEKSPTQEPSRISDTYPRKRARLDPEAEQASYDMNRLLPRPAQKDGQPARPVPLLPAMVTGLHEPPPSAALLPSMDTDACPEPSRSVSSKMQVKDILREPQQVSGGRPPELMLNTPEMSVAELSKTDDSPPTDSVLDDNTVTSTLAALALPKRDPKIRRARRKWSEQETIDLLAGVKKHGFGKWKQILTDPDYSFAERTSIDLKDRFRVFAKELPEAHTPPLITQNKSETAASEAARKESVGTTDTISTPPITAPGSGSATRTRRKRHPWTKEEDTALLQGVNKYGFQWTDIHNDEELSLGHRRATDLRDRIRNLYPEGYKRAEARPLRKEMKRAEKLSGNENSQAKTTPESSHGGFNHSHLPQPTNEKNIQLSGENTSLLKDTGRKSHTDKAPSIAILTVNNLESSTSRHTTKPLKTSADNQMMEANGVTLPSLDLDEAGHTDWGDNTLAPFIGWDDNLGM